MPPDLFIFLRRAWSFDRRVTCRISASEHRATGRAVWAIPTLHTDHSGAEVVSSHADNSNNSISLTQTEEGTLTLGNARDAASPPLTVRAAYSWLWSSPSSRNDAIITFPDGRIFLEGINFLGNACSAHHDCSPDSYEGHFKRTEDGKGFCISYSVIGPRKDYTSITTYLPLQED
jgi:hypothetical protein